MKDPVAVSLLVLLALAWLAAAGTGTASLATTPPTNAVSLVVPVTAVAAVLVTAVALAWRLRGWVDKITKLEEQFKEWKEDQKSKGS